MYGAVCVFFYFLCFQIRPLIRKMVLSHQGERERRPTAVMAHESKEEKKYMIRILISEKIWLLLKRILHILLGIISRRLSCRSMRQCFSLIHTRSFPVYSLSFLSFSRMAQFNLVHNSIFLSYTLNCRSVLFRVC